MEVEQYEKRLAQAHAQMKIHLNKLLVSPHYAVSPIFHQRNKQKTVVN